MSKQTSNETFYFAKALLYTKLARDYFEYLIVETKATMDAKRTLKNYVGRYLPKGHAWATKAEWRFCAIGVFDAAGD